MDINQGDVTRNRSGSTSLVTAFIAFILWSAAPTCLAAEVYGRITLGGYAAQETSDPSLGSERNDFLTASGRFFLNVSQMGSDKNWSLVSDLRDKNDFFDKLNRERLRLEAVNTFQVRQMKVRYDSTNQVFSSEIGRFPVLEAGQVHCDGLAAGLRFTPSLKWAAFGGLNPRRHDQAYLTYNEQSYVSGTYFKYQSQNLGWERNFYSSLAFTNEAVGTEVDRQYIFHNTVFQWSTDNRVLYLLYLDFVPRANIQTAFLNWRQGLLGGLNAEVSGLAIDVIEYSRRQGVRERLDPSPYKEGNLILRQKVSASWNVFVSHTQGKREVDGLAKRESVVGTSFPRFFSPRWDASLRAGVRDNFITHDVFGRGSFGYFTQDWESTVDIESGVEEYPTGETLHPLSTELSLGWFVSRPLFIALSAGRDQDERVGIWTAFFKLSYRFGSAETPPVRDGASPRGRL